jgi:hypothetical protein
MYLLASRPIILPARHYRNRFTHFFCPEAVSSRPRRPLAGSSRCAKGWKHFKRFLRHLPVSPSPPPHDPYPGATARASIRRTLLPNKASEQPPCQMTLREQQPDVAAMVPSVLDQPATRLHQPLLQAGCKPASSRSATSGQSAAAAPADAKGSPGCRRSHWVQRIPILRR